MVECKEKPFAMFYAGRAQVDETDVFDGFNIELRPTTVTGTDLQYVRGTREIWTHELFEERPLPRSIWLPTKLGLIVPLVAVLAPAVVLVPDLVVLRCRRHRVEPLFNSLKLPADRGHTAALCIPRTREKDSGQH